MPSKGSASATDLAILEFIPIHFLLFYVRVVIKMTTRFSLNIVFVSRNLFFFFNVIMHIDQTGRPTRLV